MFERFETKKGSSPKPSKPDFELTNINRGSDDGSYASCSDAGMISLRLRTVDSNPVGYIFEVVEGTTEDEIFYPEPIKPSIDFEKKVSSILFG